MLIPQTFPMNWLILLILFILSLIFTLILFSSMNSTMSTIKYFPKNNSLIKWMW
uniref:ATP synthetase F0 Subunit 8 n=1 Tax=Brachycybe lecontii TaxID=1176341 RepID=S4SZI9_BRALC|nr:ATP synthase F0 subunit 8 [Brachycybe lecontii]AFR77039.1 ATP synthetase F0 Subunit 8 [Brachycybe lecontii]